MNAQLVTVGDVLLGTDGTPMRVFNVQHLYEGDGPGMNLRQILITLQTVELVNDSEAGDIPRFNTAGF